MLKKLTLLIRRWSPVGREEAVVGDGRILQQRLPNVLHFSIPLRDHLSTHRRRSVGTWLMLIPSNLHFVTLHFNPSTFHIGQPLCRPPVKPQSGPPVNDIKSTASSIDRSIDRSRLLLGDYISRTKEAVTFIFEFDLHLRLWVSKWVFRTVFLGCSSHRRLRDSRVPIDFC